MVRTYFRSGMDFLATRPSTCSNPDWFTYLQRSARPSSPTISSTTTTTTTNDIVPLYTNYCRAPPSSRERISYRSSEEEPKMWRFWSWIPPMGEHENISGHVDIVAGYELQMAHFKEYLRRSAIHLYTTSELRQYSILEYSPMMDYVSRYECSNQENKENFANVANSVRSYFIFKDGVRPLWEDEFNVAGGCWTMRLNSITSGVACPKDLWKLVIRILTDEEMKPFLSDEICGVGLTIRRQQPNHRLFYKMKNQIDEIEMIKYKITVWNKDANNTIAKMMIGQLLKSLVTYRTVGRLVYTAHSSTIHQTVAKHQRNKRKRDLPNECKLLPFSPKNIIR